MHYIRHQSQSAEPTHQKDAQACRLVIRAVRPLAESAAAEARRQVPTTLARIAAEMPGAWLRLDFECDEKGAVSAALTVGGTRNPESIAAEITPIVEQFAELDHDGLLAAAPAATSADGRSSWPVQVCTGNGLGFATSPKTAEGARWAPTSDTLERAARKSMLAELAGTCPGHGLHLWLSPSPSVDVWRIRMWVSAPAAGPSLRTRAAIRHTLQGLQLSTAPVFTESGPVIGIATMHLHALFSLPIAGADPVPGMEIGSAATIPVTPGRNDEQDRGIGAIRLGRGRTRAGFEVDVSISAHERLRHVHIVGRTGTGKSSLLAAMAKGVAAAGEGLLLLDPHGTLVDRVLRELPAAALERTWFIDSGNVHSPVPINPLAVTDPAVRDRAIDEVCAIFQYLFDKREAGIVGPRFRERVAMGLRALIALRGSRASILDVPLVLADTALLKQAAAESTDARLRAWVQNDALHRRGSEYGDLVSWVNSKFEAFASTAALRGVLGSGIDAFDMATAMDERRIILVDLSKGPIGEPASRLLGFLHLNRTWQAALRRETRVPFTVMIDEAHAVTAGALTAMLSEGRKFGLSVVLAHQYLRQLDEDLLSAIDGNVATTISFRAAVADLPSLGARSGRAVPPETYMTLPDLSAVIVRTAIINQVVPHRVV